MTALTAEIRALLARVPVGYTPGPWSWLFGPGQDYYEMCAQDGARYPGLSIYDHGAATENLDLATLAPELAAALTRALAALEDQPPVADAALLAAANRALCERLEAAEREVIRLTVWCTEESTRIHTDTALRAAKYIDAANARADTAELRGAERERERIVAWLRPQGEVGRIAADAIERGAHLETQP